MDTQALSNIVHAILASVVEKELVEHINTGVDNGDSIEDCVKEALKKVKLSFKATQVSTANSSNKPVVVAAKTSKTVKKDVLFDDNGIAYKCCAIKKSDNMQCAFDAKEEHNGKFYCKTHHKSATKDKPSKEKKPSFTNSGQKSSSSVEDILSEVDSSIDLDL